MQNELSCKTAQQLKSRKAHGWKTSRLIPRRGHILLRWVFQRLEVRIEKKRSFLAFSFLVLSFAFVLGEVLACTFVRLVRAKTTLLKTITAFLTSLSCLFIAKECSSGPFGSSFAFSFSSFSSFHLAALEKSGLPGTLSVVSCPKT